MTITGDDLPYTITAPWPDQKAFWEAKHAPKVLREPPPKLGPGYDVVSWYWGQPLGEEGMDDIGVYYPDCIWEGPACERGVVRVSKGDEVHWLELDAERDALLKRYVELGRAGVLPSEPTIVEVLAARMVHSGEEIAVGVGGQPLEPVDQRLFWDEAAAVIGLARTFEYPRDIDASERLLLTFRLPEGRTVNVRYLRSLGCFCEEPTGGGLPATVELTGLPATPRLQALLEELAPPEGPGGNAAARSASDDVSSGVPLWAIVTAAAAGTAGVAVVVLGPVAVLRRWRR
jgi:hypothetical protein